jgi:hypothetical protein
MKATLNVTSGAVRVIKGRIKPPNVAPTPAPHTEELDGEWAIGSATTPGNVTPGAFSITALEAGTLRVFTEARDAFGQVEQSNASEQVELAAAESRSFATHDSNAFTVSAS